MMCMENERNDMNNRIKEAAHSLWPLEAGDAKRLLRTKDSNGRPDNAFTVRISSTGRCFPYHPTRFTDSIYETEEDGEPDSKR